MKLVSWRSLTAIVIVAAVMSGLAWVVPGSTPEVYTDISGLTLSWIVPTTKQQSSSKVLYYSNNPEYLTNVAGYPRASAPLSIDSVNNRPACLAYSGLTVGKTYRIFVAHANATSSPAQNVGVALMIRTTGTGSFRLNNKAVGSGINFPQVGIDVGRSFLDSSYSATYSIPTAWNYLDGPYTISVGQCIVMMYDITVTSGSGAISLAVSAAPSGVNHATAWQSGLVWDAAKEQPLNTEDHFEAGTFYAEKNVTLNVNLDTMTTGSAKTDRIGHYFSENQPDPTLDGGLDGSGRTNDGWVDMYSGALNSYLPGNFGVIYHYTVNFSGSSTKQGAVLIGSGETASRVSGLVMKRSGSSAVAFGPIDNVSANYAWLVGKASGGSTLTFDILVPANINLPYRVYCERYQ